MKKIWEYVSARAKSVISTRKVMSVSTLVMGLFHIALLAFFVFYRIYPLAVVNVLSVLIYIFCYKQTRENKNLLGIFNIINIEVVVHSVIATIMLGNASGFTLYLIAMIPLGFYATYNFSSGKKYVNPMNYVILNSSVFVMVRIACNYIGPFYTYGNDMVDKVVYMINYFVIVVTIVFFFSTLLNQIKILDGLRKRQNENLEKLSKIDPLTGLTNRRSIEERHQQAELLKLDHAIILGDIDDFKKVNDTYGHDVGDEVLKAVAGIFKKFVSSEDVVCRWGGEEILIFLSGGNKVDATMFAEQILSEIRNLEIPVEGQSPIHITVTLGVAISSEGTEKKSTIKLADERLYKGKQSGKNKAVCE